MLHPVPSYYNRLEKAFNVRGRATVVSVRRSTPALSFCELPNFILRDSKNMLPHIYVGSIFCVTIEHHTGPAWE
jgi:hypothetical protein